MPAQPVTAAAAGTWTLAGHTVHRMGFGSMRITANPDRNLAIAKRGIAFVPFFAIAGARREAGAGTDHDEAVRAVARAHGATPHQVRLAWTLHQGPHVLAIPGTGDLGHLEQNIAAGALRFTPEDLATLGQAPRPS